MKGNPFWVNYEAEKQDKKLSNLKAEEKGGRGVTGGIKRYSLAIDASVNRTLIRNCDNIRVVV